MLGSKATKTPFLLEGQFLHLCVCVSVREQNSKQQNTTSFHKSCFWGKSVFVLAV